MSVFEKALRWYQKNGRDLPWRKTRSPYRILLSEVMLQQTQVDRVIFYYKRWLKRYPSWRSLAVAKKSEVIQMWSGLGYNRRALFLKQAAEQVVKNGVPENKHEWLLLKGVGEYTARAVSVFCQNKRLMPIDTNIRRVLGRLFLGKPFPSPKDDYKISGAALKELEKIQNFQDVPQALFDIASLYCTKTPNCQNCPLKTDCKAAPKFLSGTVRIPKRTVNKTKENIRPGKKYPDRIYRGRILKVINEREGISISEIGTLVDPNFRNDDQEWIFQMINRLEKDGLIERKKEKISLPKS